jgi:UMF1 family MFS transporter
MGVQTVILLASMYGNFLGIDTANLILTILIIQFVAIGGAYLFTWIAKKHGNLRSIQISILIWTFVCFVAYTLTKGDPAIEYKFYTIGALVGLVLGGIQSISRSTYSKMLKEDTQNHASYFSFYDVAEKIAVVIGTAVFGLCIAIYDGDMKMSALSLSIFFAIGFLLILRVPKTKYVR